MKVHLSHPDRSIDIKGPKKAREVLRELNLVQEAHLVIRGDELITEDELLKDDDLVEIRPVISGGSADEGFAAGTTHPSLIPRTHFLP